MVFIFNSNVNFFILIYLNDSFKKVFNKSIKKNE